MLNSKDTGLDKNLILSRRVFILSIVKLLVFGSLVGRLFSLQIKQNKKYKTLSDNNRIREWKLAPQRGIFKDYFGKVIADNSQVFQLHIVPEDIEDIRDLLFRIKSIVSISQDQLNKVAKKIKKQKPWEPVIISDNLSWEEFSKLNLFLHELPGIKPVVSVARYYPDEYNFSHVLGYVSDANANDLATNTRLIEFNVPGLKVGKTGLEKNLDNQLIGDAGYQRFEVNAYGKRIKEIDFNTGKSGEDYKLTIDAEIQDYGHKLLEDKSGSICVMDVLNGDVVAMISSPSFNPNKFVHGINKKDWNELLNNIDKPLVHKSVAGLYPPGSTIKPIVALSALEHDVISPKLVLNCTGSIELYGQKYHCWKKKGHGYLGLRNAIKQSCDCYFYEVARRLGVDRLSVTAKKFGLGDYVLENFIEEKKGTVPNTKWKLKNIGKGWVLGETLISGIGQGYFQTSPLQICLMMAQLANGGYKVKPRIIDNQNSYEQLINIWKKRLEQEELGIYVEKNLQNIETYSDFLAPLVRNHENVKFVNEAMFGSTNEPLGTSYRSRFTDPKYVYAGKTGTSQVKKITEEERESEIKIEDIPYQFRDHALFVAFAPYKNPRYALSVVIEHGGSGSSSAAPIAKKLIKKILDRHALRMSLKNQSLESI